MDPLPEPQTENKFEMVLTHRQVTVILLLLLIVMGLVATMAYVAGQSVSANHYEDSAKRARPKVIVPMLTPRTAPTRPPEPAITDISSMTVEEPPKGGIYLQVGSVDKAVALAFQEFLARRGISAHDATRAARTAFRVLGGHLYGS